MRRRQWLQLIAYGLVFRMDSLALAKPVCGLSSCKISTRQRDEPGRRGCVPVPPPPQSCLSRFVFPHRVSWQRLDDLSCQPRSAMDRQGPGPNRDKQHCSLFQKCFLDCLCDGQHRLWAAHLAPQPSCLPSHSAPTELCRLQIPVDRAAAQPPQAFFRPRSHTAERILIHIFGNRPYAHGRRGKRPFTQSAFTFACFGSGAERHL